MLLSNQSDIQKWLDNYSIENYILIPDHKYGYIVDVNDNVNLSYSGIKLIEVKFNIIKGNFDCSYNFLYTLKGSPKIVEGYCDVNNNNLTSLKYVPHTIHKEFCADHNLLKSLFYFPQKVLGNYIHLYNNELLNELQNLETYNDYLIYKDKQKLSKINTLSKKNNLNKI